MPRQKLDVSTLHVSSFEVQEQPASTPVCVMTGTTGYCNTCEPTACNWTV